MSDTIDARIAAIAASQHGVFARWQVRDIDADALLRRTKRGVLVVESRNVLRLAGAPRTDEQRVKAATLDVPGGGVASYFTAAWLWSLPGFSLRSVEITGRREHHRASELAHVHHHRLLLEDHVTQWRGIDVTSVALTIFNLAAVIHPSRLARLVSTVCSRSPAVHDQLHDLLPALAASGRDGIVSMRSVLERWPRGCALPGSGQEIRFEELMAKAGITGLRRQVDVGGHSWVGRVDYVCDDTNVVFELDSQVHHTSPVDVAADARRDAELLAAGHPEVVRIWTETLWNDPHAVQWIVRNARARNR